MQKGFSLGLFLVLDLTILLTSFTFFSLLAGKSSALQAGDVLGVSVQATYGQLSESGDLWSAEIIPTDARSAIIDSFLLRYQSPMAGIGTAVVENADKYGLPFWLVPAIAQCESNLGKRVPADSHNAWGWGIYGEKVTRFETWEQGVEKVSQGLSKNYLAKGLTSPEEIMKKYTPGSNGSWAFCVQKFLNELK